MSQIHNLRQLLSQNRLDELFAVLSEQTPTHQRNNLLVLKNRWNRLEEETTRRTIDSQEKNRLETELSFDLSNFLDRIDNGSLQKELTSNEQHEHGSRKTSKYESISAPFVKPWVGITILVCLVSLGFAWKIWTPSASTTKEALTVNVLFELEKGSIALWDSMENIHLRFQQGQQTWSAPITGDSLSLQLDGFEFEDPATARLIGTDHYSICNSMPILLKKDQNKIQICDVLSSSTDGSMLAEPRSQKPSAQKQYSSKNQKTNQEDSPSLTDSQEIQSPFSGPEYESDGEYIRTVCFGDAKSSTVSQMKARSMAKFQLANQLHSKVISVSRLVLQETDSSNKEEFASKNIQFAESYLSNVNIIGFRTQSIDAQGMKYRTHIAAEVKKNDVLSVLTKKYDLDPEKNELDRKFLLKLEEFISN